MNSSAPPNPRRPSGRLRPLVVAAVEIAVVGFVGYYLWSHADELRRVWALDARHVAALLGLVGAASLWRTVEFRTMLAGLAVRIGFGEAYALIQGATLLNHAPLNAGTLLRAQSLKQQHGLSYTRYVAMMSAQIVTLVVASAALCLIAVLVSPPANAAGPWIAIACALALLAPLLVFFVPPRAIGSGGWFRDRLRGLVEGWQTLGRKPARLALLLGFAAVKVLVQGLRLWVCFVALGVGVGPVDSVLLAAASSLVFIVNITPAAIGLRELLIAGLAAATGLDFTVAVAAAGIDRVAELIGAVATGAPSLAYLRRRYRRATSPGMDSRRDSDSPGDPS